MNKIPFNIPVLTGKEEESIHQAIRKGKFSGDGDFTKLCSKWLESELDCKKAFLTTSCTHALEMSALLLDIKQGDEVILPSFTFTLRLVLFQSAVQNLFLSMSARIR